MVVCLRKLSCADCAQKGVVLDYPGTKERLYGYEKLTIDAGACVLDLKHRKSAFLKVIFFFFFGGGFDEKEYK